MLALEVTLPNGTTVESFEEASAAGYPIACEAFALCDREATHVEPHPVLEYFPACDRCGARLEALR